MILNDLADLKQAFGIVDKPTEKPITIVQFGAGPESPETFSGKIVNAETEWLAVTCDRKIKDRLPQILERFDGFIHRAIVHSESLYIYMEIAKRKDFRVDRAFDRIIKDVAFTEPERQFRMYFKYRQAIDPNTIKSYIESAVSM